MEWRWRGLIIAADPCGAKRETALVVKMASRWEAESDLFGWALAEDETCFADPGS